MVATAALRSAPPHQVEITFAPTFADVVALDRRLVAIDIPIGLLESYRSGGRTCDAEARARLGWPRGTSVFSAPARCALAAPSYAEAKLLCPMSRQSFGILPKVAEVDRAMSPALQDRVVEVHPELTFAALNGPEIAMPRGSRALAWSKKTPEGRAERSLLLAAHIALGRSLFRPAGAQPDDLLDALAALITAIRVASGRAFQIPADAPTDDRGLRMEIWI